MRRWRPLVLATGFCGLVGWGASAQTLTEAQALTRMRMEHPQIRVLRFTVREVEAAARERSLLANPTVSYTREDAGLNVDDFLLVTQELPVRRRLGLLGEAGEQAVNAAQARADADLLAFDTRLRLAFTDLLLAQERTQTLEATLSDLNRLVDVLRAREEQGEGSRFDRLRAEREVADIDTDLGTVAIDRLTAQARLASFFALGTDPGWLDGRRPRSGWRDRSRSRGAHRAGGRASVGLSGIDTRRSAVGDRETRGGTVAAAGAGGHRRTETGGRTNHARVRLCRDGHRCGSALQPGASAGRSGGSRAWENGRRAAGAPCPHRERGPHGACHGLAVSRAGRPLPVRFSRPGGRASGDCHGGVRRRRVRHSGAARTPMAWTLGAELRWLDLAAAGRRAAIELDRAIGQETTP